MIALSCEWLQLVRKWLVQGSWLTVAMHYGAGGAVALLGGLVSEAGEIVSPEDKEAFDKSLVEQQKRFKELADAIPDESKNLLQGTAHAGGVGKRDREREQFGGVYSLGFGKPEEEDLKLIRHLREEFKKKDPSWGGLKTRDDGKFGRIWAYPE